MNTATHWTVEAEHTIRHPLVSTVYHQNTQTSAAFFWKQKSNKQFAVFLSR